MENFEQQMEFAKMMMKQHAEQLKKQYGLGVPFDTSSLTQVSTMPEVMLNIYLPVAIFTNEEQTHYYVVDDKERLVYLGNVDKEGLQGTIEKDTVSTPEFVNFYIALVIEDEEKLMEYFNNQEKAIAFLQQLAMGAQEAKDNGHL